MTGPALFPPRMASCSMPSSEANLMSAVGPRRHSVTVFHVMPFCGTGVALPDHNGHAKDPQAVWCDEIKATNPAV